ncbi:MAG: OadG family protein [Clostridia bacterium]|nr:OadG family protein [Clostridia bacterium]
MSNTFVVVLGIGTVFIGLISLILLCKILGLLCGKAEKEKKSDSVATTTVANTPVATSEPIVNRQEIIAAVSAVIAEELGTDISALRILSFKKI